jgi:hypothetical protein
MPSLTVTHTEGNYNNMEEVVPIIVLEKVGLQFFREFNAFRTILLANSCGDLLAMVPVPAHETKCRHFSV